MDRAKPESRSARRLRLDALLDEALVETFPASDPIAIGHPTANERSRRPADRKPPTIDPADLVGSTRSRKRHQRRSRA